MSGRSTVVVLPVNRCPVVRCSDVQQKCVNPSHLFQSLRCLITHWSEGMWLFNYHMLVYSSQDVRYQFRRSDVQMFRCPAKVCKSLTLIPVSALSNNALIWRHVAVYLIHVRQQMSVDLCDADDRRWRLGSSSSLLRFCSCSTLDRSAAGRFSSSSLQKIRRWSTSRLRSSRLV